ncbi:hypothetical protein EDB89DRAFT_2072242 [Lactarius sanguifluus]|nr:hypothetical protein EDB89DRAFT_2072242 [Lactarius sanguifluus]
MSSARPAAGTLNHGRCPAGGITLNQVSNPAPGPLKTTVTPVPVMARDPLHGKIPHVYNGNYAGGQFLSDFTAFRIANDGHPTMLRVLPRIAYFLTYCQGDKVDKWKQNWTDCIGRVWNQKKPASEGDLEYLWASFLKDFGHTGMRMSVASQPKTDALRQRRDHAVQGGSLSVVAWDRIYQMVASTQPLLTPRTPVPAPPSAPVAPVALVPTPAPPPTGPTPSWPGPITFSNPVMPDSAWTGPITFARAGTSTTCPTPASAAAGPSTITGKRGDPLFTPANLATLESDSLPPLDWLKPFFTEAQLDDYRDCETTPVAFQRTLHGILKMRVEQKLRRQSPVESGDSRPEGGLMLRIPTADATGHGPEELPSQAETPDGSEATSRTLRSARETFRKGLGL